MSDRLTAGDLEILVTVGDEVTALALEVQAHRKLVADLLALRPQHGVIPGSLIHQGWAQALHAVKALAEDAAR